jgi:hypothetical protein
MGRMKCYLGSFELRNGFVHVGDGEIVFWGNKAAWFKAGMGDSCLCGCCKF